MVICIYIQNYDKFELIGTGGFAKVYRGVRLCDKFDVAIKIVWYSIMFKLDNKRINI